MTNRIQAASDGKGSSAESAVSLAPTTRVTSKILEAMRSGVDHPGPAPSPSAATSAGPVFQRGCEPILINLLVTGYLQVCAHDSCLSHAGRRTNSMTSSSSSSSINSMPPPRQSRLSNTINANSSLRPLARILLLGIPKLATTLKREAVIPKMESSIAPAERHRTER